MPKFLIVGSGLVGCVLAIYLARRGHRVQVFERHPDPRSERARGVKRPSINLTLCERGLLALRELGLEERALALAVPALGRRIHGLDASVTYQPYGNHGEAIHSISRRALNEALLDSAAAESNVEIYFQQKCVGIDLDEPSASFENVRSRNQSTVHADCIFAADGAYSAVRSQMQKTLRFDYSQEYWTQGYRELTMPPTADGRWPLEPDSLHIWPRGGYMLIGFANPDHSFSCALHLPFEGENSHAALPDAASLQRFVRDSFPDAVELLPALAEEFFATPPNPMVTIRCKPWHHLGKALLVGDSAHAILPSYGQGANAGFEDCSILDRCLRQHAGDLNAAFAEFERRRRPDMNAMAELCVEHFMELRDRVGDAEFLRHKAVERRLNELYPDLYEPLYSMISFGNRGYAEALMIERRQQQAVAEIASRPGAETRLEAPEIRSLLERARGAPGAAH